MTDNAPSATPAAATHAAAPHGRDHLDLAPRTGGEVRLAARPVGRPAPADFRLLTVAVHPPAPGEVLVRNRYFSLDAALRLRLSDVGVAMPPLAVGEALAGDAVGEVMASASPGLAVGDTVRHGFGWREYVTAGADRFRRIDPDAFPTLAAHLASFPTAWVGLVDVAGISPGETVFVSGAAGAVGGLAGQIARLKGAGRVVGSAGSPAKVAHLVGDLGFDAAFDHHDGPIIDRLREAAPHGVDVFFDTTGGEQLQAALEAMNPHGRVALCGVLGRQNGRAPGGEVDLTAAIGSRLTLRGFRTGEHAERLPRIQAEVAGWLRDGRLVLDQTVVTGLANAPRAFIDMLAGAYTGRVLVAPFG
ncbi:NADP-dependent oxidoreductase [Frankia sp. QA3]|uniref:MDR family NADP-dependent oxidoreductase n=1 Tax=Frankia sp. QA3 TaxID=710111 RepID=UPI000269C5DF|nr:NADP-dependent oxidoreductase [Frankia sp. QA3]EIV93537.1 putative NADP-dependent oxidoreductase [Frankia sp. QA3]